MAERLRTLPVTRAAWHTGTLTTGQVEIILANLDKQTIETFAAHETELVPLLRGASTEETALAMRRFAAAADAVTERVEPADPDQTLHVSRTLSGRRVVTGDLDPETGDLLETALRVFANHDDDENGSPARRRADALGDLCRFALDHHDQPVTKRNRPHVTLIYNTATGHAETLFGERFTSYATQRLLCDAIVQPVYFDGTTIVHVGEPGRTPSARLFNAIAARDRHCRFPGCDRPVAWTEAHHVTPWPAGPTSTDNLVLFCSRHHHRIHHPGWHTKLLPDATLEITRPDGTTLVSHPPGMQTHSRLTRSKGPLSSMIASIGSAFARGAAP
jgi:hypothetical protein